MANGYANSGDLSLGNLCRYIGQTVTIFTASGGASGCGFTGVLMSANECFVRLLTKVGAAPDCPIGCNCSGCNPSSQNCRYSGNGLGSVVVIPTDQIVSFVHNAI